MVLLGWADYQVAPWQILYVCQPVGPSQEAQWLGQSSAVCAVSDNLYGPYVDKGQMWSDVINGVPGRGHNVTALALPDGRYAVLISETRPGSIYIAKSLDGPWEFQGPITFATNQFSGESRRLGSNMSIMVRPDGNFEIVQRSGLVLISTNGVMGPYEVQGPMFIRTPLTASRFIIWKTRWSGSAAVSTTSSSTVGAPAKPTT